MNNDNELKVGEGWRYQCRKCGHEVGIDAQFPKECPGCHKQGWWGRLVFPVVTAPDPINNHNGIMQTNDLSDNQPTTPKLGGIKDGKRGNGHRGRPKVAMPEDLIEELAGQGHGSKVIAQKLTEQGTPVHYSTVWRHLQRSKIPNTNQN